MKKNFKLGQKVLWINNSFDGRTTACGTIIEVNEDHCLCKTSGNNNNLDDMTLWIDEDNEMEFFDC